MQRLYFGVPYFDQWGIIGGHTSAYRWHLNDPIVFNKGIKFTIEHFGWMSEDENPKGDRNSWNERQDDYSSVAFWYQTGEPTFTARAPHARERKLPNLDRVMVLAKDFLDARHHGPGRATPQTLGELYPQPQMLYLPTAGRRRLGKNPLGSQEQGAVAIVGQCHPRSRLWHLSSLFGRRAVGQPIDLYNDKVEDFEYHLLDFWPEPGKYTFTLRCVGKNAKSAGCKLGLESVRLRERRPRVAQYGRDKDKDWRKNPTVFQDD